MNVNTILKKAMVLLIAVLCFVNSAQSADTNYCWTDPETGLIYCVGLYDGSWMDYVSIHYGDSAWVCGIDPELAVSHPTLRSTIVVQKPICERPDKWSPFEIVGYEDIEIPVMPVIAKEQTGKSARPNFYSHSYFKCPNLTEFIIPEGITNMGVNIEMENLKTLKFPKHLEICFVTIKCDKLEQLELAEIVSYNETSIYSKSLTSLVVQKGIKCFNSGSLDAYYLFCPALKTITLPQQFSYFYTTKDMHFENVYFHDDVTEIHNSLFSRYKSLKNVTFPKSLQEIGYDAFNECDSLKSIVFETPSSLKKIGHSAFYNCKSLTDITIPYGVDTIEYNAFSRCTNVDTIKIPKSVKYIDMGAFGCESGTFTNLKDIYVHWEKPIEGDPCIFRNSSSSGSWESSPIYANTILNIVDDNLWDTDAPSRYLYRRTSPWKYFKHKKYSGGGWTTWSFRNTIGAVGNGTVCYDHYVMKEKNGSITETAITNEICNDTVQVTTQTCWIPIEEELNFMMEEGDSIVSVLVNGQEMKNKVVLESQSWNSDKQKYIYTYNLTITGITSAYTAYVKFSGFEEFVIKDNIEFADTQEKGICVANWDTDGDGELSKTEAAAVTDLGQRFRNSNITSFSELQYFTGLTTISERAFSGCKQLKSITLPTTITSIGDNAFTGCEALEALNIPAKVSSIGESALAGLKSLKTLTVDAASQYFMAEGNVLYTKDRTQLIVCSPQKSGAFSIPSSVKELRENVFYQCDKLTSVTLPNGLTTIGAAAFVGCGITTLNIPDNVTDVGYDYDCPKLRSITVASSNQKYMSVDGVLFQKSPKILVAYPPAKGNVYEIPRGTVATYMCSFIDSPISDIQLPSSVTDVDTYSFAYCKNLTSVTVRSKTPPTCYDGVFYQSSASTVATLYVPTGTRAAYQAANGWKDFNNIVEFVLTDIDEVNENENGNEVIYNLAGQRLTKLQRGVNIVGGRKVVRR